MGKGLRIGQADQVAIIFPTFLVLFVELYRGNVQELSALLSAVCRIWMVENLLQVLISFKVHLMPLDGVDDSRLTREKLLTSIATVCAAHLAHFVLENVQSLPLGRYPPLIEGKVTAFKRLK
jgi:hypothetical protein